MLKKKAQLEKTLSRIKQAPYPHHSRVHPLKSFPLESCYVKREDELGFGISGSKIRKYRTLIPSLREQGIKEVLILGSGYSNNVLSLTQLLIENGIQPTLFLKKGHHPSLQGNLLLTSLFASEEDIHWIKGCDWNKHEQIALDYANTLTHPFLLLKEGASIPASFPGALSLPLDILINEKELKLRFDHIFIEAGTGMMASALILGYQWINRQTQIHVLLLAQKEQEFLNQLSYFHSEMSKLLGDSFAESTNFKLYRPRLHQSFGSTSTEIFKQIRFLAKQEGFLTDPLYTAKLFIEARKMIEDMRLSGNILIIHSGGALTLCGYQEELRKVVEQSYISFD